MSSTHPRTSRLEDRDIPEVAHLLGEPVPAALEAIVAMTGGEVAANTVSGVTWWPGRSITVRYRTEVTGGDNPGSAVFVATAGRIPKGAVVAESEGLRVGLWRFPHDPLLPGLPSALHNGRVADLLVDLGSERHPVRTRLRAYRPTRRAVVEVRGGKHDVFLKVIRPGKVESLHRTHRALADAVLTPVSLGVDPELGIVALQAMPGITLRSALESPTASLPSPTAIVSLTALPAPDNGKVTRSAIERVAEIAGLLALVAPELQSRLEEIVRRIGQDDVPANHPVHGDFYESQLMVKGGEVVGMLDVDTYGWGRPGDDAATMLGHLAVWTELSTQPDRVKRFADELLALWAGRLDPVDLRRRTAAVVLSLIPGPFRVQSAAWPSEVSERLTIAEKWMESADSTSRR